MSDKTSIEWTDATWNPIRGCSRVSEGCRNCYAEKVAARFSYPGRNGYINLNGDAEGHRAAGPYDGLLTESGQWNGKIKVVYSMMDQPLRWRKPRRIFVNSMSDLFHENVPDSVIQAVFTTMAKSTQHTFQVLTKRPQRMCELILQWERNGLSLREGCGVVLPNVWLGVSAECQDTFDERTHWLLRTPAAVRWVSLEPLLSPIDCEFHEIEIALEPDGFGSAAVLGRLDWVVVGGESGKHARPMHPGWVRSIRDQCQVARVSFLFKQWGEWLPGEAMPGASMITLKIGKRKAGRLLDGREWNEYPVNTTQ